MSKLPLCSPDALSVIDRLKERFDERSAVMKKLEASIKVKAKKHKLWANSPAGIIAKMRLGRLQSKISESNKLLEQLEASCRRR